MDVAHAFGEPLTFSTDFQGQESLFTSIDIDLFRSGSPCATTSLPEDCLSNLSGAPEMDVCSTSEAPDKQVSSPQQPTSTPAPAPVSEEEDPPTLMDLDFPFISEGQDESATSILQDLPDPSLINEAPISVGRDPTPEPEPTLQNLDLTLSSASPQINEATVSAGHEPAPEPTLQNLDLTLTSARPQATAAVGTAAASDPFPCFGGLMLVEKMCRLVRACPPPVHNLENVWAGVEKAYHDLCLTPALDSLSNNSDKPEACILCPKTFKTTQGMLIHCHKVHGVEAAREATLQVYKHRPLRTYQCEACDKPFMRKHDLTRHKREVHEKVVTRQGGQSKGKKRSTQAQKKNK